MASKLVNLKIEILKLLHVYLGDKVLKIVLNRISSQMQLEWLKVQDHISSLLG